MASRPAVAVIGASGFIGSRLVEWLVLNDLAEVRPIVRSFKGMVRPARFQIDCRVADATDQQALEASLRGCELVFHCVTGDSAVILRSAESTYRAAGRAGARRLVYLSSAVVHGTDPVPGTHDDSELVAEQPFEYNVSKVRAEQLLRRLRTDETVGVVTLRPSIVFGPRSLWWTIGIANELLSGQAYLVDGGSGICNTVYVDNLVRAMWQAGLPDTPVNQDFLITDGEKVTWRDLYGAVARAFEMDISDLPSVDRAVVTRIWAETRRTRSRAIARRLAWIARQGLPPMVADILRRIGVQKAVRRLCEVQSATGPDYFAERPGTRGISSLSPLVASLQDCRYVLPIDKARRLLGYEPHVTFSEGCTRTEGWLRFAFGVN